MRSLLFGGVRGNSRLFDLGLLPLRAFAGLALALGHGLAKVPPSAVFVESVAGFGFPMPLMFVWGAAASEIVGGVLLALGLLTRPAAFAILCTMTVAVVLQHANDPFELKERALLYGGIALLYLCLGAGKYSLDARVVKR